MNKESHQVPITLIGKLFQTLILSKSKTPICQIASLQTQKSSNNHFNQYFSHLLSTTKSSIRNLCLKGQNLEESIARKIVNILMFLSKEISFLLAEGVLNLYMDLVELKEKVIGEGKIENEGKFVEKCIEYVEPLLLEFFVYREYKKMKKIHFRTQNKNFSLAQRFSGEFNSDEEIDSLPIVNQGSNPQEQTFQQIRSQISSQKINEVLKQFLNQYEKQLNNLEQVCKICTKNIKVDHLQQHVEYCQKKYIIKQDIKCLQNKMVRSANEILAKRKTIQQNSICQIKSGPLTAINDLDVFGDEQYEDLLYEIIHVHRIGSLKNNASKKKIHSRKESFLKYDNLIEKLSKYLQKSQSSEVITHEINTFLSTERQIVSLNSELRNVQLQYENIHQIGSSSTIEATSKKSTTKINEKRSHFAFNNEVEYPESNLSRKSRSENKSRSSKVCFRTSKKIAPKGDYPQQAIDCKFDNLLSYQNFSQDSMFSVPLKTKQSLCKNKSVHFLVDEFEQDGKQESAKPEFTRKISRRVKSMVMFDHSEQSDNESQEKTKQNVSSQSISKYQQSVGIKDFEVLKFLGKGAFGKVYAVRKRHTQDLYALKMIDIDQGWGSQQFSQVRNEHQIFKKVAGQHLVQAPYCFSEGGVHFFMMEFMPGGDLSKVLEQQVYLEEQRAKYVIAQIVLAIQHLHRAQIIHRDLKPENLVIDQHGHLKLTDFGLSQIKLQNKIQKVMNFKKQKQQLAKRRRTRRTGIVAAKQKAKIIGTPDYIAPQIINSISINNRSIDWWSLGVISYEILIGARPFCGNSIQKVLDNILKLSIQWPEIGDEEGMISERAYDFIQRLLSKDFLNRLGAQDVNQIKNHPFFDGVDWQSLKHQPAHITPNYTKVKQLLKIKQDQNLRKQIEQKMDKQKSCSTMHKLDNFIRFDILGEKTVKQANKIISKKAITLKRLQSIKQIMTDRETASGENSVDIINKRGKMKTQKEFKEKENKPLVLEVNDYI